MMQVCPTLSYSLVWQREMKSTAKLCLICICLNVLILGECPKISLAASNENSLHANQILYKKKDLRNKPIKRAFLTKTLITTLNY